MTHNIKKVIKTEINFVESPLYRRVTHREGSLLDVRLLVQNAKLVVPVYQLYPREVPLLNRRLVHGLETQHLSL